MFELSPNIVDDFCGMAHAIMTSNVELQVPVRASWGTAESWGDLK
jgi:DNA polymerase I-like protein with 3'-5' exonuclease and polymerase domains